MYSVYSSMTWVAKYKCKCHSFNCIIMDGSFVIKFIFSSVTVYCFASSILAVITRHFLMGTVNSNIEVPQLGELKIFSLFMRWCKGRAQPSPFTFFDHVPHSCWLSRGRTKEVLSQRKSSPLTKWYETALNIKKTIR